jgi:hypothetical protein
MRHVGNAVMHGIHDVFPPDGDEENDPISLKKLRKLEAMWALQKEILGFDFDGLKKTMWLAADKRDALLTTLKKWLRGSQRMGAGIPLEEFESVLAKLRHAFTTIPEGNGLMSPGNRVLAARPPMVYLHRNKDLRTAIEDSRTLLRESTLEPTRCSELVMGWPEFVGVMDASGEGVGGVVVGEDAACVPTVYRMEWPEDVKKDLKTSENPAGRLSISDFEMAGFLFLFLVMEAVCSFKPGAHVALFSDNQPTVSWVERLASKSSVVAGQLVRALALRMKKARVSPVTPLHIRGAENPLADVPSRSFGKEPKWHCRSDNDLLTLFNKLYPLPRQNSWTVFHPSSAIFMRVCSVLRMKATSAAGWRQLPSVGQHVGEIGERSSHLWEWTLTCGGSSTSTPSEPSRDSQGRRGRDILVTEGRSKVGQFQARSRPLRRTSPWCKKRTRPS